MLFRLYFVIPETCKQHDMGVPAGIFLDSINFVDFVKRFYQEFPKKHTHLRIYLRKTMEKKFLEKIWK